MNEGCDRCDGPGDAKTYRNQAKMPINGRVQCIDWCIHHIVAALNVANVRTLASCCGHGRMYGRIDLEDGRTLIIRSTPESLEEQGRMVDFSLYDKQRSR